MVPEFIDRQARKRIGEFCESRVPLAVRDKVWLEYKKRGSAYTLIECRPDFRDPSEFSRLPIAKFRYDESENSWELRYADRNERWHIYFEDVGDTLEELLAEVDEDPTHIFWG